MGTMRLPVGSTMGAVTVAVNRSPTLEVLVDRGVSKLARFVVPGEMWPGTTLGAETTCEDAAGTLVVACGGGGCLPGGICFCGSSGSWVAGSVPAESGASCCPALACARAKEIVVNSSAGRSNAFRMGHPLFSHLEPKRRYGG